MAFLAAMAYWHWWIAGLALLVLEMLVPGTFFLWMGIAAGVVGLLMLVLPDMSWQIQFLVFAVLSVVAITASRMWLRRHPITTDDSTLNRRGSQYVGRVVTLDQPLVDGTGKVRIEDTFWRVATPDNSDLAAGVQVRITGVDGIVLKIEPVQSGA